MRYYVYGETQCVQCAAKKLARRRDMPSNLQNNQKISGKMMAEPPMREKVMRKVKRDDEW